MKTAEEWCKTETMQDIAAETGTQAIAYADFIKQIQLDAFKAGMTEAAELCRKPSLTLQGEIIADAILSARDNLKEI